MEINEIIGLSIAIPSLIALIVLLYIVCLRLAYVEKIERKARTKLYKKIVEYIDILEGNDNEKV